MQALGVSTEKLTLDIAALDAALSTESALNIADTMDANALAAARAREAEATAAAAAAQWQLAGSGMGLRSLHPLLREVTREAGAVAGALSFAMFHPGIMGAGFAATMIFMQVKRQIEEVNKVLDESAKLGNAAADWPEKVKKGLLDSLVAMDDYERKMSEIGRDLDPIKTKTDEYTTALNEQSKAAESVASAHKKLEEARIEAARLAGTITKEQAIVMKLDLDEADFERKLNAEVEKAQKILAAKTDERKYEAAAEPGLKSDYEAKTHAAAQAEADKERFESTYSADKKKRDEYEEALLGQSPEVIARNQKAQEQEGAIKDRYDKLQEVEAVIQKRFQELNFTAAEQAKYRKENELPDKMPTYEAFRDTELKKGGALQNIELKMQDSNKALFEKYEEKVRQEEAGQVAVLEAAAKAKDAAKQAADAWSEALKTIAAADKEIKKQTTELGILQNENARIINESRQTEWQTKVNNLGEEYEKDAKQKSTPALRAEMESLKKQHDDLLKNKPSLLNVPDAPDVRSPFEYRTAWKAEPTPTEADAAGRVGPSYSHKRSQEEADEDYAEAMRKAEGDPFARDAAHNRALRKAAGLEPFLKSEPSVSPFEVAAGKIDNTVGNLVKIMNNLARKVDEHEQHVKSGPAGGHI